MANEDRPPDAEGDVRQELGAAAEENELRRAPATTGTGTRTRVQPVAQDPAEVGRMVAQLGAGEAEEIREATLMDRAHGGASAILEALARVSETLTNMREETNALWMIVFGERTPEGDGALELPVRAAPQPNLASRIEAESVCAVQRLIELDNYGREVHADLATLRGRLGDVPEPEEEHADARRP